MFTTFTYMWYVYTLSFDGIPFYVGMTKDPVDRYKGHYQYRDCHTYNLVRYMVVSKNKMAEMALVFCSPDKDLVLKMESTAISTLSKVGFSLLNKDGNCRGLNRDLYPIYPHVERLPHGILKCHQLKQIKEQRLKILKEYGY